MTTSHGPSTSRASVVIPAHDEEATIGRLLDLLVGPGAAPFEVVVACNGCTDSTAEIARRYDVTVLDLPEAGKVGAMSAADEVLSTFPRLYVDADVELTQDGALALVRAFDDERVMVAGPERIVPRDGVPWHVRAYYDVWEAIPAVRTGLFGRGVFALSRAGLERLRHAPAALGMADDLVVSEAFAPQERAVSREAQVVVHPPRTWRDLLSRRTRVVTGNVEADGLSVRDPGSRTTIRTLVAVVRTDPRLALRVPLFALATVQARLRSRRAVRAGDFTTWERDESSRRAAR